MSDDEKRIQDALETLSEFFDAVHVFAIRHETEGEASDGTAGDVALSLGRGSYYARCGLIREWCLRQDERSRMGEHERE